MKHSKVLSRLSAHLEGELRPAERRRVAAHLRECESCAAAFEELSRTVGLLRDLPEPEPPPRLAARVLARIDSGEVRPPLLGRWLAGVRPALAPLAAAAAGLGGFLLLSDAFLVPASPTVPASERVAVAAVDPVREAPDPASPVRERAAPEEAAPTRVARAPETARTAPPAASPAARSGARVAQSAIPEVSFADTSSRPARLPGRRVAPRVAAFGRVSPFEVGLARVDRDLDRLLAEPEPVLAQIEGLPPAERRVWVDGLVQRARQTQMAEEVAARVREVEHPLAKGVADCFEGVLTAESMLGR